MQLVINIPDEQIKKSLEESKYMHEDEGEKGFVDIMMLYTDGQLDFVDVSRKTDFYSCKYKVFPKGHGNLIQREDAETIFKNARKALLEQSRKEQIKDLQTREMMLLNAEQFIHLIHPIIEAESEDKE